MTFGLHVSRYYGTAGYFKLPGNGLIRFPTVSLQLRDDLSVQLV
jgi:hypothetical protein